MVHSPSLLLPGLFSVRAFYVIQDHPAYIYIPRGQRWPLRPELAAPLGVWPSSQLAECAAGRGCWGLCGDVAVLPCCTVHRISSSGRPPFGSVQARPRRPGRSALDSAARQWTATRTATHARLGVRQFDLWTPKSGSRSWRKLWQGGAQVLASVRRRVARGLRAESTLAALSVRAISPRSPSGSGSAQTPGLRAF